jgi:hypothetical protein
VGGAHEADSPAEAMRKLQEAEVVSVESDVGDRRRTDRDYDRITSPDGSMIDNKDEISRLLQAAEEG